MFFEVPIGSMANFILETRYILWSILDLQDILVLGVSDGVAAEITPEYS